MLSRQSKYILNRNNYKREKGLSLIEVCFALGFLSIVLMIMMGVSTQGSFISGRSGRRNIAVNLAKEKIEELSVTPLSSPGTTIENYGTIDGFSDFKRQTVVSWYVSNQVSRVIVTVYWDSDDKSVVMSTLKSCY